MTVISTGPIVPRMWRGYDDPGLPVGAYLGHLLVVGDVTGDTANIEFNFKRSGDPASGRFYNIEQINLFTTANTFIQGSMAVRFFDRTGPFQISVREYRFDLENNGVGGAALDYHGGFPEMPLFLGQSSRLSADLSRVAFSITNVNTVVFQAVIQGYIWEARSILSEGGLRRPIDSVYGR